jgi:hypothetical protein
MRSARHYEGQSKGAIPIMSVRHDRNCFVTALLALTCGECAR